MSVLYNHLLWFYFLFSGFLFSFFLSIHISWSGFCWYLNMDVLSVGFLNMKVSFFFDFMSTWFMTVVFFISSVIMIYSYNYMMPYSKSIYFLWFTFAFVLSMIFVILISDVFFVMLGWDGLGVVSFFLIVYYQNQSSVTSGIFTLLMNRVGDSFFLVTIVLMYYLSESSFIWSTSMLGYFPCFFLVLTFMTKSAIFPFSPWLPLAMAAPTPISALVHSSTLVTSGLYLMMRYSYVLYSSCLVLKFLLALSIFTSFYAGLNSVFEMDFKKLIALSTLSHLGFISLSFSLGLLQLSYFHLLTHALFKSLLFMSMGDIMINLSHSQDSRYLSSGFVFTPFSSFVMSISIFNLLGLPSLSGFYSKDLILEMLSFSSVSLIFFVLMFINVIFTYLYSFKLASFSFHYCKMVSYQVFHSVLMFHSVLLLFLAFFTVLFGKIFTQSVGFFIIFMPIPILIKMLPLFLMSLIFFSVFVFLSVSYKKSLFFFSFFSSMLFLSNLLLSFMSKFYFFLIFNLFKSSELGYFSYFLNTSFYQVFVFISNKLFKFVLCFSPISSSLFFVLYVLMYMV